MAYALVTNGLSILGVGDTEAGATEDAAMAGYGAAEIQSASMEECSQALLEHGGGAPEQVWRDRDGTLRHESELR